MTERATLLIGDCRETLRTLPDASVNCCVTSPPYFGLRDYGTAKWEGGDVACDHKQGRNGAGRADGIIDERSQRNRDGVGSMGGDCSKCGARRIDSQIGLEQTPEAYVAEMVAVFREVRRVLRDDGTLWLNLGDSYWGGKGQNGTSKALGNAAERGWVQSGGTPVTAMRPQDGTVKNLKPKDLIGIPWMVALALRADGWYLRQDIIWHKPNPMPESVTDRCTKSHEYVFLLAKSARYWYDAEAIKEAAAEPDRVRGDAIGHTQRKLAGRPVDQVAEQAATRNRRSVWTVATQPYRGAHFATFPPKLIDPCIMAGCPSKVCAVCGSPFERKTERTDESDTRAKGSRFDAGKTGGRDGGDRTQSGERTLKRTIGHRPTCDCGGATRPGVTLDPFNGAGTTGLVALQQGRHYIGCELNPEYAAMSRERWRPELEQGRLEI